MCRFFKFIFLLKEYMFTCSFSTVLNNFVNVLGIWGCSVIRVQEAEICYDDKWKVNDVTRMVIFVVILKELNIRMMLNRLIHIRLCENGCYS